MKQTLRNGYIPVIWYLYWHEFDAEITDFMPYFVRFDKTGKA